MNKNITLALVAALSLGIAGSASAATASGTLNPQATVAAACVISSASLDFGSISGVLQANVDVAGVINLNCTANLPYSLAANGGANSAKTKIPGRRAMISGANATGIDYDLFTDSTYATRFTNLASGAITGTSGASGGAVAVPVHGRVFSGQTYSFATGTVSDTVGLTITF